MDFLTVGHIVKDVTPGGWRLGGSVAYAVLQAHRLGLRTAAVTACSPDVSPAELLPHTQWHVLPDEQTTTFENVYAGGARRQWLTQTALPIGAAQVPSSWCSAGIAFIAPVFHDVDVRVATVFPPGTLVGLGAQGWLRQLHGSDIAPGVVERDAPWLIGDIVFVSEEDVTEPGAVESWLSCVPMVVLTRGPRGCTVFDDDGRHEFPAFEASEVDPTGAGDCFATAFLLRWRETADLAQTAAFAAAAGALAVQGSGLEAVPTRAQIESLIAGSTAAASGLPLSASDLPLSAGRRGGRG